MQSSASPQVVSIASWNTDLTLRVPRPLRKGETLMGHTFSQSPGGKGSNATIACARQGASTAILACIGDDGFGQDGLSLWACEGIDTRAVWVATGERSGVAQILVYDDGDNSIAVAPGAGARLNDQHVRSHHALIQGASLIMASNEVPLAARLEAFQMAKGGEQSIITLFNPAPAESLPEQLLALCDVLTPNEAELFALAGMDDAAMPLKDAALALINRLPQLQALVVTRGAKGCELFQRQGSLIQMQSFAGHRVEPVVDTVGAGDAFTGALAAATVRGLNWTQAVAHANAAAALSVRGAGAIGGLPSWEDTRSWLAQRLA